MDSKLQLRILSCAKFYLDEGATEAEYLENFVFKPKEISYEQFFPGAPQ
jgi:hypothetical protein